MKRRVFANGPSLVVTLPSSWVKSYNIATGDELDVNCEGRQIVIETGNLTSSSSINADFSNIDRTFCQLYLRSLYKKGYSTMNITFSNADTTHLRTNTRLPTADVINEKLSNLIGIEAINEGEHFIEVKDLTGVNTESFDNIFRKIFFQIFDYVGLFFEQLLAQEIDDKSLDKKHVNIEKFIAYGLRLLNKKGYSEHKEVVYHILESFEFLIDIVKYSARDAKAVNPSLGAEGKDYLKRVDQLLRLYYDLYYKFDNEKIRKFNEVRSELKQFIPKNMNALTSKELLVLKDMEHFVDILFLMVESRMGLEHK